MSGRQRKRTVAPMKKWLSLLAALLLMLPLCANAEDRIIIDKIKHPADDFAFPADAQLLEIYFPKIYDSAAALIRYGEYTMLFDCADDQWGQVSALLDRLGVTELTYACNSHPHRDHIYGFPHVLKDVPAREFLRFFGDDYEYTEASARKAYAQLRELGIPFRQLGNGDTIPFGDVKITALQCLDPEFSANNASALLMVELGQRRFLFASDIQIAAQRRLLADDADVRADILQHPHHGYDEIRTYFLEEVDPELVIITSLPNASNGAAFLRELGVPYLHTHLGITRMTTDGNVWVIERFK